MTGSVGAGEGSRAGRLERVFHDGILLLSSNYFLYLNFFIRSNKFGDKALPCRKVRKGSTAGASLVPGAWQSEKFS